MARYTVLRNFRADDDKEGNQRPARKKGTEVELVGSEEKFAKAAKAVTKIKIDD